LLLRNDLLRLVVFLVKIWLPKDFEKTNFPDPVFLKRFAAARFVLILGIFNVLLIEHFSKVSNLKKNRWREQRNTSPRHVNQLIIAPN
jgi:hypothetical protein